MHGYTNLYYNYIKLVSFFKLNADKLYKQSSKTLTLNEKAYVCFVLSGSDRNCSSYLQYSKYVRENHFFDKG